VRLAKQASAWLAYSGVVALGVMLSASAGFARECFDDAAGICLGDRGVVAISGRAEVTDGDTLEIGPVKIRLYGIDAPEASQVCARAGWQDWSCGQEATHRLAGLADGKQVRCVARDHDRYNRI